jgi:hypothetical protein
MVSFRGRLLYEPTPKQRLFHECAAKFPLFGGAAGGGKSMALRWHLYMTCLQVPHCNALLLRRSLRDLERTHLLDIQREAPLFDAVVKDMTVIFHNGSRLELGHCNTENSIKIYLSAEYDIEGFDELVTFTERMHLMIASRCRTTKPNLLPRVLSVTNPGGIESLWVQRRWIDKDVTFDEDPTYIPEQYAYIPARLEDNPHLDRRAYEPMLLRLPPHLAKAYRYGEWNVFEGQFFPEFTLARHVVPVDPIDPAFPRFCGLDWGYSDPGVCLWLVALPDGTVVVEDEYTFNQGAMPKQIAAQVGRVLTERTRDRGVTRWRVYADPSMFSEHGLGESLAESMQRERVPIVRADKDRIQGWGRVRAWLADAPGTTERPPAPRLLVHPRCTGLIRSLPRLTTSETSPEDCVTKGPDHWADALRYALMSRVAPTVIVPPPLPPESVGLLKQQLLGGPRRRPLGHTAVRRARKGLYAARW